uniref:InaF motif containing 2 n=1 Tax=Monopterus albus TaxID=43700 RepID=A0A3Q3IXB0_MONAL
MKAAGSQVTVTAEKLNGDMKRRPSYAGELRAKHVNMSTKIWVKVAMAIAYFLAVSVAAFILAIYYVFFWTPNNNNGTSTEAPNRTECPPSPGGLYLTLPAPLSSKRSPAPTERARF